jgi:hypothetical protein
MQKYEDAVNDGNVDLRISGALRWLVSNTTSGNRNDNMFRFAVMLKDPRHIDCHDWEAWTRRANTLLSEPLPERELNTIIRSASNK